MSFSPSNRAKADSMFQSAASRRSWARAGSALVRSMKSDNIESIVDGDKYTVFVCASVCMCCECVCIGGGGGGAGMSYHQNGVYRLTLRVLNRNGNTLDMLHVYQGISRCRVGPINCEIHSNLQVSKHRQKVIKFSWVNLMEIHMTTTIQHYICIILLEI